MGEASFPPEGPHWERADEALDEDDPLSYRLAGIVIGLTQWRRAEVNSIPDQMLEPEKRQDRNDVQIWLSAEIRDFFAELNKTKRLCEFTVGQTEVLAHRLRRLGDEYALFEAAKLMPGTKFFLDYTHEHTIPQEATFDQTPGLMSGQQIYLGDTRREMAVSLTQLATALRDEAQLTIL